MRDEKVYLSSQIQLVLRMTIDLVPQKETLQPTYTAAQTRVLHMNRLWRKTWIENADVIHALVVDFSFSDTLSEPEKCVVRFDPEVFSFSSKR